MPLCRYAFSHIQAKIAQHTKDNFFSLLIVLILAQALQRHLHFKKAIKHDSNIKESNNAMIFCDLD